MSPSLVVLLAQAFATLFMTGLGWFVQVVHYPLFSRVGEAGFAAYHERHSALTTQVVGLPMLAEIATAAWLVFVPTAGIPRTWAWAGLVLVGLVWASTAFLQIPQHGVLGGGYDEAAWRRLVAGNWLRTIAWTLRSVLVLAMLVRGARAN